MSGTLEGKVAIVTGSGQSIGRSIALLMAEEGAAVITNSRSEVSRDGTPTAADTTREIIEAGGRAKAVYADVGTMDGAAALVDAAVSEFGAIDILVNNAGFGVTANVEDMTEEQWDSVIDANLKGPYATAHFALPHMKAQKSGRIINVISRVGLAGSPSMSAYSAAKLGAVGFTFAMSKEVIDDGITVNALAPTANTVRAQRTAEERYRMTRRVIPGSPNRTPDHIAPLAVHLAGPETGGITGQVFYASAGEITLYAPPTPHRTIFKQGKWTIDELTAVFPSAFGTEAVAPVSPLPPT